jgi:lipopolysaccharide export system permease protein
VKILSRYILSQFLVPFLLSLFAFSVIILIIQVFDELHFVMLQKPGFWVTLEYYVLKIPGLLLEIIPIAVLMAVLFSLGNLGKLNELMAMRAGGVSIFMVARPILFCGVLVFVLTVLFNELIVPKSNYIDRQIRWNDIEHRPQTHPTSKANISLMGTDNQMVHIGNFDGPTNTISDIIVLSFDNGIHLKSRIDAKKAVYENGQWIFQNGYFRIFDDTGAELSCKFFDSAPFALNEKPEELLKDEEEGAVINIVQLFYNIEHLKENGADYHKELIELHKKIAVPFACVVLALLGVSWGWSLGKYSGMASSFGICMIVAFVYIGGMQILQTLGTSGTLSPFVSTWTANILFGMAGVWLLIRKNH